MKMNVENKLNKVVKILKEKGFVVYRKGGKEPGVFYAKEGDSRIGFVYPNNGYIYDRIKMWSFSRIYKPHKKTGSSCLMCVSDGRHRRQVGKVRRAPVRGGRGGGDAACITWRKATVDEIVEHFKNR